MTWNSSQARSFTSKVGQSIWKVCAWVDPREGTLFIAVWPIYNLLMTYLWRWRGTWRAGWWHTRTRPHSSAAPACCACSEAHCCSAWLSSHDLNPAPHPQKKEKKCVCKISSPRSKVKNRSRVRGQRTCIDDDPDCLLCVADGAASE